MPEFEIGVYTENPYLLLATLLQQKDFIFLMQNYYFEHVWDHNGIHTFKDKRIVLIILKVSENASIFLWNKYKNTIDAVLKQCMRVI